jgi:glycosyltransferase involved in cell wall biosynthesis
MSAPAPLFSVVLIARNEYKTLPRLMASLEAFRARGGNVYLLDTGSVDGTPTLAEQLGCHVTCVGERFLLTIDPDTAAKINAGLDKSDFPAVRAGDRVFDYSAARNFAASLADQDVVAMPDCDEEYTKLDLDKINESIQQGHQQFEYDFVFAHDEHGNELIKFRHCKFYHRKKLRWTGVVHEVLSGESRRVYLPPSTMKLEHWQQPNENRARYLPGLALDCHLNPDNDRNCHYYARELYYHGRHRSAIRQFERHVGMKGWPSEAAQSVIFMGDCWMSLRDEEKALACWQKATLMDASRREPWMRLADHFFRKGDHQKTASYAAAALTIPWADFYANNVAHYRDQPHALLYWALWWLGDREGSFTHWRKARELNPDHPKYRQDSVFYLDLLNPKVSVVIPTLNRPQQLEALVGSLTKDLTGWSNFEVVVQRDAEMEGAPKTLKKAVEASTGDYILFLGDDCRPQKGFMRSALARMFSAFPKADGLVGLNDCIWDGKELATHWMGSRSLLPKLDGEFFHTGYFHAGCDNELTARCKKMGLYVWEPEARITHDHPTRFGWEHADEVHLRAYSKVDEDRKLLAQRAHDLGFQEYLAP